jgi:uncharacterized protein (TIGR02996 family)
MRRFTYTDAKSHKFWAIDLQGKSFTVTFGRVGTEGQSQTKTFPTEEKAKAEHDKLIKEKTGKGYIEEGAPVATRSDREVLEAAVVAHPEDRAAHAALADYLLEQGDPRGEFIRVQLALEDESLKAAERKKLKEQEAALLKAHEREWLGPFADAIFTKKVKDLRDEDLPKHAFIRGLLARVEFPSMRVDQARAFVASPGTATVRELLIGVTAYEEPGQDYEEGPDTKGSQEYDEEVGLRILGRWKHFANVRVFRLGEPVEENYKDYPDHNCRTPGGLAPGLVRQIPNVEELYLLCRKPDTGKFFGLPMPRLRILQVYHADRYAFDKLAQNESLGNLTHLLCHPRCIEEEHPYIRLPGLKAIARSPYLKSLTHLRLRLSDMGDDGIAEIINSGLIKRLKVLDLRHGVVTDAGAELLAGSADARNLELIDLSFNTLTADGTAALKRAKIKHVAIGQWTRTGDEYGDMEYLNAGDYE